jgi:hypothetical protein
LVVVADFDHVEAKSVVCEQSLGAPAVPASAADVEVQLLLVNDQAFSHLLWSSSGNLTAADEFPMNLAARHAPRRLIHRSS